MIGGTVGGWETEWGYMETLCIFAQFFLKPKKKKCLLPPPKKKGNKRKWEGHALVMEAFLKVPSQGGWGHNFRASILHGEVLSLWSEPNYLGQIRKEDILLLVQRKDVYILKNIEGAPNTVIQ